MEQHKSMSERGVNKMISKGKEEEILTSARLCLISSKKSSLKALISCPLSSMDRKKSMHILSLFVPDEEDAAAAVIPDCCCCC